MGIWNVGIFQNDTGSDVKTEYRELMKLGYSDSEVFDKITKNNQDIIQLGGYDELEFWLALAKIQWEYGRLDEHVKQKALNCLESDWHLEFWIKDSPKLIDKRRQVLQCFINEITGQQPIRKQVKIHKSFICPWAIGDIFAYELQPYKTQKNDFAGGFISFQKVENEDTYPQNLIPVLQVAKKVFSKIPTIDEFLEVSVLPQFWTPRNFQKNIIVPANVPKLENVLYDLAVDSSSIKAYPKNIIHIGNSVPIRQHYKQGEMHPHTISWKEFDQTFFMMYEIWKDISIEHIL